MECRISQKQSVQTAGFSTNQELTPVKMHEEALVRKTPETMKIERNKEAKKVTPYLVERIESEAEKKEAKNVKNKNEEMRNENC